MTYIKRISEVAEVRDLELSSHSMWEKRYSIPNGRTFNAIVEHKNSYKLSGMYHCVINVNRRSGFCNVYIEAEDGSYYFYNLTYINMDHLMLYWKIVWLKRRVLFEKVVFA